MDNGYDRKINLIQIDDPSDEVLAKHNLSRGVCDDVIIGSALAFEHRDEIVVVSHDNGLLIKAKNAGLKFLPKMPEEYLVTEEKSEEEKEYERCRKELEQLKNRQPKPYITFANGETVLRLKTSDVSDIDDKLDAIMARIKSRDPKANVSEDQSGVRTIDIYQKLLQNPMKSSMYSLYDNGRLKKHNKELEKYYAYCERYYRFKLESEQMEAQLQELSFFVSNSGSAETGDMNIFFDFPEEVRLYDERSVKRMNDIEPQAPFVGMEFSEYGHGMAFNYVSPRGGLDIPQMESWDLTKCLPNSSVSVEAASLNHNVKRPLKIKHSLYVDTKQCGNFVIEWCICAAGCVKACSGTLNVIVESNK